MSMKAKPEVEVEAKGKPRTGTIYDLGAPGRRGLRLPALDLPRKDLRELLPQGLLRSEPARLPEVSQPELVQHYTKLSKLNYGVDDGLYPLGSCTMKYNPKVNEELARLPQFALAHPHQGEDLSQGILELMFELGRLLCKLGGMDAITLQPAAGAHGELTGMFLIKKYFEERGEQIMSKEKLLAIGDKYEEQLAADRAAQAAVR